MKQLALLFVVTLTACKKTPPPTPVDAGATTVSVTKDVLADASAPIDAALAVDADFHVVAKGGPASHVIWLKAMGQRVWLSAQNLDAFADGDGPLVKGADPFAKLPYTPGVHTLQATGVWPHIFAMRTKKVMGRMESPEPTFFVYQANGEWTEAKWKQPRPLELTWFPHALVGYRDGALIVSGQIELNNSPSYIPNQPGTLLRFVGADGTIVDPKLDVHPAFMAYNADSDNKALTLLGTIGVKSKTEEGMWDVDGVHISRLVDNGKSRRTAILGPAWPMFDEPYSIKVHEHGDRAVVVAANGGTVWIVENDGKVTLRAVPVGKTTSSEPAFDGGPLVTEYECRIVDADLAGDDLWAIRDCMMTGTSDVFRIGADGRPTHVSLEKGCKPETLLVRHPADVWMRANCNGPTIFRLGRAQAPITMP